VDGLLDFSLRDRFRCQKGTHSVRKIHDTGWTCIINRLSFMERLLAGGIMLRDQIILHIQEPHSPDPLGRLGKPGSDGCSDLSFSLRFALRLPRCFASKAAPVDVRVTGQGHEQPVQVATSGQDEVGRQDRFRPGQGLVETCQQGFLAAFGQHGDKDQAVAGPGHGDIQQAELFGQRLGLVFSQHGQFQMRGPAQMGTGIDPVKSDAQAFTDHQDVLLVFWRDVP